MYRLNPPLTPNIQTGLDTHPNLSLIGDLVRGIVLVLEIVLGSIAFVISNGWETSDPNEWLILIENGK